MTIEEYEHLRMLHRLMEDMRAVGADNIADGIYKLIEMARPEEMLN